MLKIAVLAGILIFPAAPVKAVDDLDAMVNELQRELAEAKKLRAQHEKEERIVERGNVLVISRGSLHPGLVWVLVRNEKDRAMMQGLLRGLFPRDAFKDDADGMTMELTTTAETERTRHTVVFLTLDKYLEKYGLPKPSRWWQWKRRREADKDQKKSDRRHRDLQEHNAVIIQHVPYPTEGS
ncbi:hypothetical protein ACFL2T_02205 [Elusimicrobiota bacterium]